LRSQRLRKGQHGQSLVEFALVLPLFLLIVMATVDFGWALRGWITTTNAAREGARVGVTGASSTTIKDRVVQASSGLLTTADVTVTNAQGAAGGNVTVQATHNYQYITPLGSFLSWVLGGALPDPLPIASTTVMRLE
jgi:Flp pilus assembly protein TadG